MKKLFTSVIMFLLLAGQVSASNPVLTKNRIKTIIGNGANFLVGAIEPNGHFKYEIQPFSNAETKDDNIVRQAGALFVLGEIYRLFGEEKYLFAMKKSWTYFKNQISFDNREGLEVAFVDSSNKSHTGTNALLLVPLLEIAKKDQKFANENKKYIEGLINLMNFMQKDSGGIRGFYDSDLKIGDRSLEEESDYYNGEGILALVRIYEYEKTEKSKERVIRSYNYFKEKYTKEPTTPFYLWCMLAMKELVEIAPEKKEEIIDFSLLYTDWIIATKNVFHSTGNNASIMEGIGATAYMAKKSDDFQKRKKGHELLITLIKRLQEIQSWQIDKSSFINVQLNNEDSFSSKASVNSYGCFLNSKTDLKCRIDYTQHAISSYRMLWIIFSN